MAASTPTHEVTLADLNARIQAMGLPAINSPEALNRLLSITRRDDILRASEQPQNPRAREFLARVLSRAGINPPEPEYAAQQAVNEAPGGAEEPRLPIGEGHQSVHVYGGRAALSFELDQTPAGAPTIAIAAAQSISPQFYNWSRKTRLQLTRAELPVVTAVLLGILPRCEFRNHGTDKSRGFSLERHGNKVLVKVFARGESEKAVQIEAHDLFYVAALFLSQLQKTFPALDAAGITHLVRVTQKPALDGRM